MVDVYYVIIALGSLTEPSIIDSLFCLTMIHFNTHRSPAEKVLFTPTSELLPGQHSFVEI